MNDFLDLPEKSQTKWVRVRPARLRPLVPDFTMRAKVAILHRGTSISEIAKAIGRSRVVTSQAINHGLHEPTRRLVAKHLNIAA